jgi:outer membrane protein assembly factor BamA
MPKSQLEPLLPQQPNRKLIFPGAEFYLFWYQVGEKSYNKEKVQKQMQDYRADAEAQMVGLDTASKEYKKKYRKYNKKLDKYQRLLIEGNWLMRVLGEPPSYFKEEEAKLNVKKMTEFLKNKGFFEAKVQYQIDTVLYQRIRVTYVVKEQQPYRIKSLQFRPTQTAVDTLWHLNGEAKLCKIGQIFDRENIENEKVRIENLLKSKGYFYFSRNDIKARILYDRSLADSAQSKWATIEWRIEPDRQRPALRAYHLGSVSFVVDKLPNEILSQEDTVVYEGIQYFFLNKKFNNSLLDSRVLMRPGSLFNRVSEIQTQRRLYQLDQFRFVQPRYDTSRSVLDLTLYTLPLDKYQFTGETGLSIFRYEPGPFANFAFKIRNILGGLESLEMGARVGYEAQAGFLQTDNISNNLDLGLSASLYFPQLLFAGSRWNARLADFNPRTQIGLSYNYNNRQEYTRSNLRASMQYIWQPNTFSTVYLSLLDVNLVNSTIKQSADGQAFASYLDTLQRRGNNLIRSFNRAFVSSINLTYLYNDFMLGKNIKSKYFRLLFESGGTTLNLLPNKQISIVNTLFREAGQDLIFSRFLRVNADFRQYLPVGRRSLFAWRVNAGIAWAYDDSGELPYEKNFFVGGSNSIRAWEPRLLGPGNVEGIVGPDGRINYRFEQPGNVLIEGSAEFRFPITKLYGDLNGAFFVDFGNVWTFKKDALQAGNGTFKPNTFLQEMAVGTGFGIRYDFSFFIIRFDLAVKVYEPARPVGQRYVLNEFNLLKPTQGTNPMVLNIAIGYPF